MTAMTGNNISKFSSLQYTNDPRDDNEPTEDVVGSVIW